MEKKELDTILENHKKWACGCGGSRADLSGADLRGADLSCADLSRADLSGADLSRADLSCAYLRGADLSSADLSRADLRRADLSSAYLRGADLRRADLSDTVYDGVNWLLLLGIVPDRNGKARAYKVTNIMGEGIYKGGINYADKKGFSVPKLDKDKNTQCSYGVNLATLAWCLTEKKEGYRLFMMEFSTSARNCVCPIGSDGKFRVKSCVKVGECNWKGELLNP